MNDIFKDKVQGGILGFALGDALGMPVKGFSSRDAISFFKDGVQLRNGPLLKAGQFTSHTLILLATLKSFLEKSDFDPQDVAKKMLEVYEEGIRRGLGSSTQAALRRIKRGIPWDQAGDYGPLAIGRGALMRVLPVAFWTLDQPQRTREAVTTSTMITHQNEEAIASSLVLAIALQEVFHGRIADLFSKCLKEAKGTMVHNRLKQAEELFKRRVTPHEAISTIGKSGIAAEVVSSAIYCFLYFPSSFRETVAGPLLAGGDSSAIAALAGALSGTYLGLKNLPAEWLNSLESKEEILNLSQGFAQLILNKDQRKANL
ncbi:MAG: ADP-ribosylglycohydrolase family protein [bacterium]